MFTTKHDSVNAENVLQFAQDLETAIHEIATGKRKPANIPMEPMIALIQWARLTSDGKEAISAAKT